MIPLTSPSLPLVPQLFSTGALIVDGTNVGLHQLPTVRQIVAQQPHRARVFEKYGISYCCCSGNRTFIDACFEQKVDPNLIWAELWECDARSQDPLSRSPANWQVGSSIELRQQLIDVHHVFLKTELPRLSYLIDRVATRHGNLYNELWELQRLFEEFKDDLEMHIQCEEEEFFPLLEQLEQTRTTRSIPDPIPESGILGGGQLVCELELDHACLKKKLACICSLAATFCSPDTACNTSRVMVVSLNALNQEIKFYMGKEAQLFFGRSS